METPPRVSAAAGLAHLLLVLLCLNALAWLSARHLPLKAPWPDAVAAGLSLTGIVGLLLLAGVLHLLNPEVARSQGGLAPVAVVASGMLMVIPFTVLALIAELVLGWSATQPFTTAAVMTGAAGIGIEMGRLGSTRAANTIVPVLAGGAFVALWMLTHAALQAVTH